jgi:hypothetical protein
MLNAIGTISIRKEKVYLGEINIIILREKLPNKLNRTCKY